MSDRFAGLQQHFGRPSPDACLLAVARSGAAAQTRAAACFLRKHLLGDAGLQYEQDAGQHRAIVEPPALWVSCPAWLRWRQQRLDRGSKFIIEYGFCRDPIVSETTKKLT